MAEGPKVPRDGLIVERLDGETLVYDTERNEAHALSGQGAAEFLAAGSEVSRREVLRKLALAGAAAAGTGGLVKTIVAPSPAQAQSTIACPSAFGGTCPAGTSCCNGSFGFGQCCASVTTCCLIPLSASGNTETGCCFANQSCNPLSGCEATTSDRNLKHHLAPVEPQDVLAAVGL